MVTHDEKFVKRSLRIKIQLIIIVIVVISCFLFISAQLRSIKGIRSEKMAIQKKIEYELLLKESLADEFEQMQSDEFVERIARDRLGLVKKGDILFIREK